MPAASRRCRTVLGGQVEAMIVNVVEASTHVRAGKLRALATTTRGVPRCCPRCRPWPRRSRRACNSSVRQGLLAPAATPAAIVQLLNRDVGGRAGAARRAERLGGLGMDVVPGSPDAFGQFMRDEIETWRRVSERGRREARMRKTMRIFNAWIGAVAALLTAAASPAAGRARPTRTNP